MAVINALEIVSLYSSIDFFPLNAVSVILLDLACIFVGKKVLGKYSKYLAL